MSKFPIDGLQMRYLLMAALAMLLASLACPLTGQDDSRPLKNIVLFVAEEQSPTMGCYGDAAASTPNIDALAAEGTRFTNAYATTASSSASSSVILSGVHNHKNGQYGRQDHFHKFDTWHDVIALALPQVLERRGYRTARIGKFHVAPEKVYHFGKTLVANERNPVLMAEECRDFIEDTEGQRPFFLYFATSDPHRSGAVNRRSDSELKPDLFGNKPNRGGHFEIGEVFYDPSDVPVPPYLTDSSETREELAQYYQSCARVDQGLGRLISILKAAKRYDDTLIVVTSNQGAGFAGAATTLYEPGMRVPLVVRHPDGTGRGVVSAALVSHTDITPSLLDFAGGLDPERNGPREWINPNLYWRDRNEDFEDNRAGGNLFRSYQGKSWLGILGDAKAEHHDEIFASHTFDEITMYYPMRALRDRNYKLIWNIAWKLDFPFAGDLWNASSWQAQYQKGLNSPYGQKTVGEYLRRPEFELYDIARDPGETKNLAAQPGYLAILEVYKKRLRELQAELNDPWISKWDRE